MDSSGYKLKIHVETHERMLLHFGEKDSFRLGMNLRR